VNKEGIAWDIRAGEQNRDRRRGGESFQPGGKILGGGIRGTTHQKENFGGPSAGKRYKALKLRKREQGG